MNWTRSILCSISLVALGTACLDTRPYGPQGYHCASDSDCEAPGFCFRQRCTVASETPVKPGPENTGPPADISLKLTGGVDITEDGTVIDGWDMLGCVQGYAGNVVIRNSRIRCSS